MKILVLEPRKNHKKTLFILHGMNQNLGDLEKIQQSISSKKPSTKIIFCIAEQLDISWPTGKEYNVISWYNYFTRKDNMFEHDKIDTSQFINNSNKIKNEILKETKFISPCKITLCGISQGGTLAIHIGLSLNFKINRILCIDTIFMNDTINYEEFTRQNYIVFQSKNDTIYNPDFQNKCYKKLKKKSDSVSISVFNLEHCECIDTISSFIFQNLP